MSKDYKRDFAISAMRVATELSKVTENKIKDYIEIYKPGKPMRLESILTDAERNAYKASETENIYNGEAPKPNIDFQL